jgi:hypothetical protein
MRWVVVVFSLAGLGCSSKYVLHGAPARPFDAVIVPGCPSQADGAPSRCQLGRAGQAAILWQRGHAKSFIVSGAAVHSPYVEAEALAQEMEVLGVPSDRIVLERNALHTDENVYYSLEIAREWGFERLAIVSTQWHASWGCEVMESRGHACSAIVLDSEDLESFMPPHEAALASLRAPRVDPWQPLSARVEIDASHRRRPPSYLLYPMLTLGSMWTPYASNLEPAVTWKDRQVELTQ